MFFSFIRGQPCLLLNIVLKSEKKRGGGIAESPWPRLVYNPKNMCAQILILTKIEVSHYFLLLKTEAVVQSCSVKKAVLRNFTKFAGKHLCQSLFLIKLQAPGLLTLLKKQLWHRCFSVNFAKLLRRPFYIEHLWWLLP